MKKLLGISIVAMLTVIPTMANATLTKENLPANYVGTPSTDLATTTYVKGAYKATSARIDEVIDEINSLNSGEGSVASQITSGAEGATFTADNDSGITSNTIGDAINELGADVEQNKSDIATINASDAMTSGIDATKVAQIATNTADIATLSSDKQDKSDSTVTSAALGTANLTTSDLNEGAGVAANLIKVAQKAKTNAANIATNADDIDTINNKTITFVQEWGGNPVTKKISQLPDFQ